MFLHDLVKIMYVQIGYLPNYPFHLISDAEMCNAFMKEGGVFDDYYPCPNTHLEEAYNLLKSAIFAHLQAYIDEGTEIPNWVYSYLVMRPISYESDEANIQYLYDLTKIDPPVSMLEFSAELAEACYATSVEWIKKLPSKYADRPPTMFGETHVTKSLRLAQANILVEPEGV